MTGRLKDTLEAVMDVLGTVAWFASTVHFLMGNYQPAIYCVLVAIYFRKER